MQVFRLSTLQTEKRLGPVRSRSHSHLFDELKYLKAPERGLKPNLFAAAFGTAKVVPFYKAAEHFLNEVQGRELISYQRGVSRRKLRAESRQLAAILTPTPSPLRPR